MLGQEGAASEVPNQRFRDAEDTPRFLLFDYAGKSDREGASLLFFDIGRMC